MISLNQLQLRYGPKILFKEVGVEIFAGDRIGLVGRNGSGKSTLFKTLLGQVTLDGGDVSMAGHVSLGYLPQDGIESRGRTLFEEAALAFPEILSFQQRLEQAQQRLEQSDTDSLEYREAIEQTAEIEFELERLEAPLMRAKIEKVLGGLGFSGPDFERDTGTFSGGWQMRIALGKLLQQSNSES